MVSVFTVVSSTAMYGSLTTETEERRRKKHEEVKMLENSHFDYYKMKMIMQIEIAGLLEIMEATKQQWV
ncbi:Protein TITANIA [Camellia lanceoleosa]|uniref:Protein TITANIA n=1 Tax=Camellia lanceoleosa TaxID=1840588 RepID=A0ACC0FJJ3_9ERIC|nr:Protein TITANIA [Camellia lanceoleosa]